ncbi:MAG: YhgE/Pip family protein [Thomasclavelia ramosa]
MNQLDNGATELQTGISQYTGGVTSAYQGSQALVSNNSTLSNGVDTLAAGASQLKAGNQQISDGLTQMASQVKTSSISLSNYTTLINTLQNSGNADYKKLAQTILDTGLSKEEVEQYGLTKFGVTDALPSSYQLVQQMSSSLSTMNTALNGDTTTPGLATASRTIQAGLNNLDASISGGEYTNTDGSKTTIPTEKSLKTGIKSYLAGTSQINSGLAQLNDNSSSLVDGANKLKTGTSQLASQTPTLTNGIGALDQGAKQLADGTSTLVSNNPTLLSGADQLADGANQISDGAGQLAAGSTTLGTGLTTLQDGANTLATSLHDGAEQVNSINSNDSTFDMLASPVDTSHKEISTVENNGHGMAPYMMSVGLYVACMAFTLMYPLFNDVEKAESGFKYWLSKASVWFTVSTIASIVMIASLMFFCDFAPQQLLMTFIFAVIVGAASMALVTLLSIVCGKIGEFVLLVFMVINLGGSAGTYPLETSSAIFKAIHPFMPFTYSVDGFRKVISMSNVSLNTEIIVFVGIIIICSLLTILVYNHRIKKPTPLIPQAFENVNE